jgi:hypothetical protein
MKIGRLTERVIILSSMFAYEIRAFIDAGCQLCGQEADGSLQWMGTHQQMQTAYKTIEFNKIWS